MIKHLPLHVSASLLRRVVEDVIHFLHDPLRPLHRRGNNGPCPRAVSCVEQVFSRFQVTCYKNSSNDAQHSLATLVHVAMLHLRLLFVDASGTLLSPMLQFTPMPLGRKPRPFDGPDWIFELKYDGFRALAVVEFGKCTLYSRNGNGFSAFSDLAQQIGNALMPRSLVLDGEIVCLDDKGQCRFEDLLFRRGEPRFVAFDLLCAVGKDLRHDRLIDRKHELRRIIGTGLPPIMYADHVAGTGVALFEKLCELDLEGIVAKHQYAPYDPNQTTWFKIRNRNYSQMVGREELFERERHHEPAPGWHSCALAAATGD